MARFTHTMSFSEFPVGDELVALTADFEVSCTPFVAAQTYGPPESCSPAEGGEVEEIEVAAVTKAVFADGVEATDAETLARVQAALVHRMETDADFRDGVADDAVAKYEWWDHDGDDYYGPDYEPD